MIRPCCHQSYVLNESVFSSLKIKRVCLYKNCVESRNTKETLDKHTRKVKLQLGFRQSIDNVLYVTFRAKTRYVHSEKLARVPLNIR